jgi:hypothetical protein
VLRSLLKPWLGALLLCSACGSTQFDIQYAPGLNRSHPQIAVFGIKRDGLMSRSGWEALGPEMPVPFGARHCPVAYSDALFNNDPPLAEAIDSYVRGYGVTDALLDHLAPAAKGDTILLVTLSGRPHAPRTDSGPAATSAPGRSGRGSRGGYGRRSMGTGESTQPHESDAPFQVAALFFTVKDHRSDGLVQLNYTGSSIEEALRAFRARLDAEFPGASCGTWDWSTKIDAKDIRKLAEE